MSVCGSGAILMEAGLMGIEAVGGDIMLRMLRGASENLRWLGVRNAHLIASDALRPALAKADCIATDPPYGRSATTCGREVRELIRSFLSEARGLIPRGAYVCLAAPDKLNVGELAEAEGYEVVERHFVYFHDNLTREVLAVRRRGL